MTTDKAREFERWYEAQVFDFQAEFLAYCKPDLLVLKGACQVFCKELEEISGFNPLERCITNDSPCNLFYRTKRIPDRTLAFEPVRGWHAQAKPSFPRCPGMVDLPQPKPRRGLSTRQQRREACDPSRSQDLLRGRLRPRHSHHVRIKQLLLARVPQVFPVRDKMRNNL